MIYWQTPLRGIHGSLAPKKTRGPVRKERNLSIPLWATKEFLIPFCETIRNIPREEEEESTGRFHSCSSDGANELLAGFVARRPCGEYRFQSGCIRNTIRRGFPSKRPSTALNTSKLEPNTSRPSRRIEFSCVQKRSAHKGATTNGRRGTPSNFQ
ncbi:uncharacterized protein LOC143182530 [Calliopsis andreniformis]|uniref:uncharacterized protein LOC143182530 n=1 Tax=Calliopsis andreniformis TaxID=337506 RepID=UPI003FCE9316